MDTTSREVTARTIDPEVFNLPLRPPQRRMSARPAALGPVHALVLDLPALTANQPTVLTWLAVFADPWPGPVAIWRSVDGTSFEQLAIAEAPATLGETLDDLPVGPTSRWDHVHSMRARLYGGTLASAADSLVLDGRNVAAVQNAGGAWEVLQFANAELVDSDTYQLSRLLRGQAGSEWAMAAPLAAGAPFVVLDRHVLALTRSLDDLGRPMQLRIVAANRDYGDPAALALTVTPQPTALEPLSPVHVRGRRTGAGVEVSWTRRTRIDGDNWAPADVPLGEDSEAYEVDILSGSSVLRTLNAGTSSTTYAAADEIADFGVPQASLSIRVTQLSATVGRGISAAATLTL